MPGSKQAWPTSAACWSPTMPAIGQRGARRCRLPSRRNRRRCRAPPAAGRAARRTAPAARRPRPAAVDVEEQRARGVGRVGRVHGARRSAARAGSCRWCRRRARRARRALCAPGHVVEQPGDLGGGEIGIEQQPGPALDQRLVALGLQPAAERRRCAGPARRWRCGSACRSRGPRDRGLALVGDADGRDAVGRRRPAIASRQTASVACQISSGSCSTQPSAGKICGSSRCAMAQRGAWPSKTMARVLVVPWSIARMLPRATIPPSLCAMIQGVGARRQARRRGASLRRRPISWSADLRTCSTRRA